MPNPLVNRPFAEKDCEAAACIHKTCFAHDPWPAHAFLELLKSGAEGFVSQDLRGEVAGLILCRPAADEAEILTFAVIPASRGKGIGQSLLYESLLSLGKKSIDRLLLEVAKNNDAAISLYSKAGFSIVGERSGYYAEPDGLTDAYVMMKRLDHKI